MTATHPDVVAPGDVTTPAGVAKLLTYIGLATVSILIPALADDKLSAVEVINASIAALGAVLVYYVGAPKHLKTIVTFALAALQALVLIVSESGNFAEVSAANWLAVVVAAFAGIGVAFVPNKPAQPELEYATLEVSSGPNSEEIAALVAKYLDGGPRHGAI